MLLLFFFFILLILLSIEQQNLHLLSISSDHYLVCMRRDENFERTESGRASERAREYLENQTKKIITIIY